MKISVIIILSTFFVVSAWAKKLESKSSKSDVEEMVFYNYSIEKKKEEKASVTLKDLPDDFLKSYLKQSKPAAVKKKQVVDYAKLVLSSYKKSTPYNTQIEARKVAGPKKITELKNFDIVPYADLNELFQDSGTGTIKIGVSKKGASTFKASLVSKDVVRTNFELAVKRDSLFNIPIIESNYLAKILEKNKVKEEFGSHLLIDLGDDVDRSEVHTRYKKRIYLNDKYKQVTEGHEYRYELYLEVKPGNVLVEYLDFKGHKAEKIIHVTMGEMTYDEPYIIAPEFAEFEIYEENLISKSLSTYKVSSDDIRYFNRKNKSKKLSLNRYKIKVPGRESAFRRYLAVGDESVVYVGFLDNKKITIPSNEYINYMKENMSLDNSSKACLVQINLKKPIKDFKANITSEKATGSYEIYYMDRDGSVGREPTGLTEKVFVVSHDYGVINSQIKYVNKEIKYMQSFCTESLYLVEQL
jgi:hypothetical protein